MSARRLVILGLGAAGLLVALIVVGPRVWRTRGDSMLPSTRSGERVLTLHMRVTGLELGDLVIARVDGVDVLKRVAAFGPAVVTLDEWGLLPGAEAHPCADGSAGCARETLGAQTYEVHGVRGAVTRFAVRPGSVFLLGDARAESRDSRTYGSVPVDQLRGVVVLR